MIKVNYTLYAINNWKDIFGFHLQSINTSGLCGVINELNVFVYPNNNSVKNAIKVLLDTYEIKANIIFSETNKYEYPAIKDISNSPMDYNLYFHSKSVSKDCDIENSQNWNRYMTEFVINHWKECLKELESYDCVGVEFLTTPFNHYSGNFWWASKNHCLKLQRSQFINNVSNRLDAEKIVGSVGGKFLSMCNANINLYKNIFPKSKWIRCDKEFMC